MEKPFTSITQMEQPAFMLIFNVTEIKSFHWFEKNNTNKKNTPSRFILNLTKYKSKKGKSSGILETRGLLLVLIYILNYAIATNQIPINPLGNGIAVADTQSPIIQQLMGYAIDGVINRSEDKIQLPITPKNDSLWIADTVYAFGKIGFGIEHFDRQDGAYNKNGAYEISSKLDGMPLFHITFDTLSFDDTAQMHKLVDYPYYVDNKKENHALV